MIADNLIKIVLAEKAKDDPCWPGYEQVGMKKKGKKSVPNCVPMKEAVEDMTNAKAILTRYGYEEDPRHINSQEGTDMWYRNPDGHQVFVAFNPNAGIEWHMYHNNSQKSAFKTKEDVSFYKGDGAYTLADMMNTVHSQGW